MSDTAEKGYRGHETDLPMALAAAEIAFRLAEKGHNLEYVLNEIAKHFERQP